MRGLQRFTEVCKCSYACLVKHGRVAQSVEQRIENPRVTGSIPVSATNKIKDLTHVRSFFLPLKKGYANWHANMLDFKHKLGRQKWLRIFEG